jgi:hypothetical protein
MSHPREGRTALDVFLWVVVAVAATYITFSVFLSVKTPNSPLPVAEPAIRRTAAAITPPETYQRATIDKVVEPLPPENAVTNRDADIAEGARPL